MVIWPVLVSSGKTADLVLACFGRFRSERVKKIKLYKDAGCTMHGWQLFVGNHTPHRNCINIQLTQMMKKKQIKGFTYQ